MKPKIFFVFRFSSAPPGKILTFLFLYHTIFLRPRTSKNRNPRPFFHTTPARNRHTRDWVGGGRGQTIRKANTTNRHFSAATIPARRPMDSPAWRPMHSPARRRSEIGRNARKSFPLFKAKGGTNRLNICEISGTIVPHNRKVEYNHGR